MGELLHVGVTVSCFHQGGALRPTGNSRVIVGGQQVWTVSSTLNVVPPPPCPFTVGTKVQPCVTVEWKKGAFRVKAGGEAVVLRESAMLAVCKSADQIIQGFPSVTASQTRVKGI
jgi:hypothetical protein